MTDPITCAAFAMSAAFVITAIGLLAWLIWVISTGLNRMDDITKDEPK